MRRGLQSCHRENPDGGAGAGTLGSQKGIERQARLRRARSTLWRLRVSGAYPAGKRAVNSRAGECLLDGPQSPIVNGALNHRGYVRGDAIRAELLGDEEGN
jgi:hypothetical protein